MVILVSGFDPTQYFNCFFNRRFLNCNRLEAPLQRGVFFYMFAVIIKRSGADALQLTSCQ